MTEEYDNLVTPPEDAQELPVFSNPWKTLSSRIVYGNPWITVREDAVKRPDNKEGIYSVVESRLAVAVVALTTEMEVVLVGQYRYPIGVYSWEVIEGGGEAGESGQETAARELGEEANLKANSLIQLGNEVYLSNCHSSEKGVVFLAKELEPVESEKDPTEELKLIKLPFEKVMEKVRSGEITDALSIIALHRAEDYIKSNL